MFQTISALPEQPPLPYHLLRVLVTMPTLIMPPGYGMHNLGLYLHSVKPSKPTTTTTLQSKSCRPVMPPSRGWVGPTTTFLGSCHFVCFLRFWVGFFEIKVL